MSNLLDLKKSITSKSVGRNGCAPGRDAVIAAALLAKRIASLIGFPFAVQYENAAV